MARKKSNLGRNILIGVAIFLAIVLIRGVIPPGLTTVDLNTGTSSSPYICPTGVSLCEVQGQMDCTTQAPEQPRVIFRTNAVTADDYFGSGAWFAIDAVPPSNNFGEIIETANLNGYCQVGVTSSNAVGTNRFTPTFNQIGFWNGKLYVLTQNKWRQYQPCSLTTEQLSDIPVEPYSSAGQETVSGGTASPFFCQGEFRVEDTNGNILHSEDLAYSSTAAGTKKTTTQNILPGQQAIVAGGDARSVIWTTKNVFQGCEAPQCTEEGGSGFFDCIFDGTLAVGTEGLLDTSPTFCDATLQEVCRTVNNVGQCVPPFSVTDIKFTDDFGNEVNGYTQDENLNVEVTVFSDVVTTGSVTLNIFQGATKVITQPMSGYDFSSGTPMKLQFTNPGFLGQYYATLEITYSGNTIQVGDINDNIFQISAPIRISASRLIAPETGTSLFSNSPVWLELETKEVDQLVDVDNWDVEVTFRGAAVTTPTPQPGLPVGTLRFVYEFNEAGTVNAVARVQKGGVWSEPIVITSDVKNLGINTQLTNILLLRQIPPSTQKVTFTTSLSTGELIDAQNEVKVVPPGAAIGAGDIDVSDSVIRTDVGTYEFDFAFTEVGGYSINIWSFSPTTPRGDITGSGGINVAEGATQDECGTSLDCTSGRICLDGSCVEKEPPIILYIILAAGAFAVILLLILVLKLRKKKKIDTGFAL